MEKTGVRELILPVVHSDTGRQFWDKFICQVPKSKLEVDQIFECMHCSWLPGLLRLRPSGPDPSPPKSLDFADICLLHHSLFWE